MNHEQNLNIIYSILRELVSCIFSRNFRNCWDNILLNCSGQNKRNFVPGKPVFSNIGGFCSYFKCIL